jgi:hypothetical protein
VPEHPLADAGANASGSADYTNATTGILLMTTPFWIHLLSTINMIAATVASVCGATIGVVGVWRILRRSKAQP